MANVGRLGGQRENIERTLVSLQRIDYPDFEIILINDQSSDNTAEIAALIAAKDSRLSIMDCTRPACLRFYGTLGYACYYFSHWVDVNGGIAFARYELKAISALALVHTSQMLSYLAATEKKVGLLLNFGQARLVDGIKRIVH